MTETMQDMERISPDKLMVAFTRSPIVLGLIVAVLAHVVFIGGTSVSYIRGLIDPAWAEAQELARQEKAKAAKAAQAPRAAAASQPARTQPADRAAPAASADAGQQDMMDKHKDSEVVKSVTSLPKPGEIPVAPDAGLPLEDAGSP